MVITEIFNVLIGVILIVIIQKGQKINVCHVNSNFAILITFIWILTKDNANKCPKGNG